MSTSPSAVSRRSFTRLFALGGSAALLADPAWARTMGALPPLAPGGPADGEVFWKISKGIQGIMPAGEKRMSEEERWHVVNYVRTLAKTQ